jgi:carboxypeptidase family protein
MPRCVRVTFVFATLLILLPVSALAQQGNIAGTVRDPQGAVMPGVLVEVTSPALIEKIRSATTDDAGQYRIANLPVGTYSVSFTLQGFTKQQRDNVVLTTGFTAPVNATMAVGQRTELVTVTAETPTVDVQNARQVATLAGEDIRDLPTTRNIRSILTLTPGLTATGLGADCVGGIGVWCNNNIYNLSAHTATNDSEGSTQGRVMVDGTIINTGGGAGIMGMTGGYVADVANAQEVNVQISGALGESETGGASINIIPRTGGNRYSGNYFVTYTQGPYQTNGESQGGGLLGSWFSANNGSHPEINNNYPLIRDYDTSGAFGGPIKRDRLWFFSVARAWQKDAWSRSTDRIWDNKNAGIWGQNYQADRSQQPLQLMNMTRNGNVRITAQASQKNKLNFFWDEGLTCQDPCGGSVAPWTARDGWWSGQVHPARLMQMGWTNPLTNVILLEAGLAANRQLYDFSQHRYYTPNPDIPRVIEYGSTVGADDVSPVLNTTNFSTNGVPSGPFADGITGLAEQRNLNDWRPRASISYVTGSHAAKIGYDGGYFAQTRRNRTNNNRLEYRYDTPSATCYNAANPAASTCGNTSLYYPNDPYNQALRPVPTRVNINTGPSTLDNRVAYSGFYVQDQWTLKRLTLSGAVRYDHAASSYPSTCIQGVANGLSQGSANEPYVPVQVGGSYAGQKGYCTPETDGVSYHDVTPRWAVAWDVFGTGKTSVKLNMGKYLSGASISGIYADANPAARTVNEYFRTWTDVDGDRVVDCDLLNFTAQNNSATGGDICGGPTSVGGQDSTRYGRDPLSLDDAGTPIGLATTQCGRRENGIPADVQAYCDVYGDTLLDGSGKRRAEWQFGLGIQHELLPRFSAEVTYNRRAYTNLTVTDQLGIGCDRYNGTQDVRTCQDGYLNFTSPNYGFFSVVAPSNPLLPGGGGYVIRGLANTNATLPTGRPSAVTIMDELSYTSNFVDTNFVWRGTDKWGLRGLRVNGGTTTGRAVRDQCYTTLDGPDVQQHDGVAPSCNPYTRWETSLRGTAAYTIPKIDVLVSTVFQKRNGPQRSANHTYTKDQVTWETSSAARATQACPAGATAGQVGCFTATGSTTATNYTVNLLNAGELYGPGYTNVDVKLGKNLRFANKRVNIGVDIYNIFNNDAVLTYQDNFDTTDNPTTAVVEQWGQAASLLSPRFMRLSIQFDF